MRDKTTGRIGHKLENSDALYRLLAANIDDVIFTMDSSLRHIYVSPSIEHQRGFTAEEYAGMELKETLADESYQTCRDLFLKEIESIKSEGREARRTATLELKLKRKDGSTFWSEVTVTFLHGEEDRGPLIVGITRNIDRRKHAEEEREKLLRRQRALLENTPALIFMKDSDMRYTATNKAYLQMLPEGIDNPVGMRDRDFFIPSLAEKYEEEDQRILVKGEIIRKEEQVRLRGGRLVEMAVTIAPVKNIKGKVTGLVGIVFDITLQKETEAKLEQYAGELEGKNDELRRLMEEVRSLSLEDELTGLHNRRGFMALAEQQLRVSNRTGREVSLFFFDLDRMKHINDTFGHSEGDRALKDVADILRKTFRDSDIIARIGGDEFVVMAISSDDMGINDFIKRLDWNLKKKSESGRPYEISLSMGVAEYEPVSPCAISELLERADSLMYLNKKAKYNS